MKYEFFKGRSEKFSVFGKKSLTKNFAIYMKIEHILVIFSKTGAGWSMGNHLKTPLFCE